MERAKTAVVRSFFDLPKDESSSFETVEFLADFPGGRKIDWPTLLESDRVLIVSEAGMGKTFECRREQERLWDQGDAAFFIELADLAAGPLEARLSPEELDRFKCWKSAQTERAVFFLDSVDELKLTRTSFERAIKSVAASLSGHLGRATIVITTRPIAIDREIINKYLPVPKREQLLDPEVEFANIAMRVERKQHGPAATTWRFVALAQLSEPQMRVMAAEAGVVNIDDLFKDILARNAHDFARRPLDFLGLCGDWKEHGSIRRHRDQVDTAIEVRLRPNTERNERVSLSPARAREGAARLALAALLARKFTIWHGEDADRASGDGALDPAKVLPDWTGDELNTLLERALFGFANYGRVRYYHRSAIEFLAADRLRHLIGKGLSSRALAGLLFATSPDNERIAKPAMRPVAAWLAPDVEFVRKEVLRQEPSLLLRYGDPESLDLSVRQAALAGYVALHGKGGWRGQPVPGLQVQRFASKELSDDVARLWSGIENPEVRETLLGLIGAARMAGNADLAFGLAVDGSADASNRIGALCALAQIDDDRLPALLDQMATTAPGWPRAIPHRAIIEFFPDEMSVKQVLGTLARLEPKKVAYSGAVTHLANVISRSDIRQDELLELRTGISALISADLDWDKSLYKIASERKDLLPALIAICLRQLEDHSTDAALVHDIALSGLLARGEHDADDDAKGLRAALSAASDEVRSGVFWAQDEIVRQHYPKGERDAPARLYHSQSEGGLWADPQRDEAWVLAAVADPARKAEERALALEAAIEWTRNKEDPEAWIDHLLAAAGGEPELRARAERFRVAYLAPREPQAWEKRDAERREANRRKHAKGLASWIQFHRELREGAEDAFADSRVQNTLWNLWRVMENDRDDRSQAGWNRGFIERMLGKELADRFQGAFAAAWRKESPTVKSERAEDEKNTFLVIWRMGLAGIYAEAEDPRWIVKLSNVEARLASRYALIDLNRLPPWVEQLAVRHPDAVDAIIGHELSEELRSAKDSHAMLLQYIQRSAPAVALLLLPRVRSWARAVLADGDISDADHKGMEHAAAYLLEHGSPDDAALLLDAALSATSSDPTQKALDLWLPILGRVDADSLVDTLERLAASISPARQSEVVRWIGALFGHHASLDLAVMHDRADLLLRLLRLANHHVRSEDDDPREGVRSVGERENAEYARSGFFNALMDAKGPEAWRLKLSLADDPSVAHYRDRIIAIGREKLAEELDTEVLTEREVVEFELNFEVSPRTRRQMADVLSARLDDIADYLRQDVSPREMWAEIKKERVLRKALAAELRRLALDSYVVVQEATTAEEKETDLRLISKAAPIEAVIELKVGENGYTLIDLRQALREQLVGKYMAPEQRRVGALVISWKGERTWQDPDTGEEVAFDEVIRRLDAEAQVLAASLGHDSFLTVRGLYLAAPTFGTKLNTTRRSKKPG